MQTILHTHTGFQSPALHLGIHLLQKFLLADPDVLQVHLISSRETGFVLYSLPDSFPDEKWYPGNGLFSFGIP